MAVCYLWLNQLETAHSLLEEAYRIDTEIGDPYTTSNVLIEQGQLARIQHNPAQALERYEAALALDQPQTAGKAAWLAGVAALLAGDGARALGYWRDAAERCQGMSEQVEYRFLAALVGVAEEGVRGSGLEIRRKDEQNAGNGVGEEPGRYPLQALRELLAEYPLPLWAAEGLRDLRDVASVVGEQPLLVAALRLLERVAQGMDTTT